MNAYIECDVCGPDVECDCETKVGDIDGIESTT